MANQFTVPQFIEHKAKIVGPLTLQQFAYLGTAGAACFILYFLMPFAFFVMAAIAMISIAAALAFGKSAGRPLPTVFKNFLIYTIAPKIYLWEKKTGSPIKLIRPEKPKEPAGIMKKELAPSIAGKSRLKDLSSQVEMRK